MLNGDFKSWWTSARGQLDEIERERRKREKDHAPRFNMFRNLGVEHRELSHSSFLANLLNPRGDHGQGVFFLESFFGYLRADGGIPAPANVSHTWSVTTEYPCGAFGRIDILVRSKTWCDVVAIENKIWARDAEGQIDRYARWFDTLAPKPETLLLYLTLDGESARAADGLYRAISYKDHIISWLRKLEESALELPAHVAHAISQYKWTLNELTGGTAVPTERSLIDFLSRTANVGYAERIAQAFPDVQRTLEEALLIRIEQAIKGHAAESGWRISHRPTTGGRYLLIVPDEGDFDIADEGRLYAALSAQYHNHELYFGISWSKEGPHPAKNCAEVRALGEAAENLLPKPDKWGWWIAYHQPPERPDMEELADGAALCRQVTETLVSLMRVHREDIVRINEIADSARSSARLSRPTR